MAIAASNLPPLSALLDAIAPIGPVVSAHVADGGDLAIQISGFHRPQAVDEVDQVAALLGLGPDRPGTTTTNHGRRGRITLAGVRVDVHVYTGRAEDCRCGGLGCTGAAALAP